MVYVKAAFKIEIKNRMKYIKVWLSFSLISFFLYDIIWLLIDFEKTVYLFKSNVCILFVDLLFCILFSATSLIVGCVVTKYIEKNWKKKITFTLGLIMIFVNMFFTFIIEATSPDIIIEILTEGENVWTSSYIFGLITPLLSLVYITDRYYKRILDQKEENAGLKMQILKMQLDPHFVFNSLSVLLELIDTSPCMATKFVIRLSRIYRYFIRTINKEWVTVTDALSFATDYMALMRVRFSNMMLTIEKFHFSTDEKIVNLSLQILLENAVKHNFTDEKTPLYVNIKRNGDYLCIGNNISPFPKGYSSQIPSTNIGLSNLSKRTKLLCDKDISIQKTATFFEVRIPIVNNNKR